MLLWRKHIVTNYPFLILFYSPAPFGQVSIYGNAQRCTFLGIQISV